MFVVIQEVQRKKPNPHGAYRTLESYSYDIMGRAKYSYRYSGGRFERPITTAYKISIHESHREGGKVVKRQFSVTTMSFYDLVEYSFYDCHSEIKVMEIAEALYTDTKTLYELIYAKLDPLVERSKKQFRKTEEYKTKRKHEKIVRKHQKARAAFAKKFFVDADEYDYSYDVFGELKNPSYLAEIEKKARSYSEYYYGNYSYSGGNASSYSLLEPSNYTDNERAMLKKFYRALSLKFHPDANPDTDTTGEMQLLNKLKEQWSL